MNKKSLILILVLISVIGLIISAYLEYISSQPVCPVGFKGCDKVIASPYSKVYGVSLSSLGLMWFLVLLVLTIIASYRGDKKIFYVLLGWSLISIPSVAVLVWVEVGILNAICIYCTAAHILGIFSIIPAYKLAKYKDSSR